MPHSGEALGKITALENASPPGLLRRALSVSWCFDDR